MRGQGSAVRRTARRLALTSSVSRRIRRNTCSRRSTASISCTPAQGTRRRTTSNGPACARTARQLMQDKLSWTISEAALASVIAAPREYFRGGYPQNTAATPRHGGYLKTRRSGRGDRLAGLRSHASSRNRRSLGAGVPADWWPRVGPGVESLNPGTCVGGRTLGEVPAAGLPRFELTFRQFKVSPGLSASPGPRRGLAPCLLGSACLRATNWPALSQRQSGGLRQRRGLPRVQLTPYP